MDESNEYLDDEPSEFVPGIKWDKVKEVLDRQRMINKDNIKDFVRSDLCKYVFYAAPQEYWPGGWGVWEVAALLPLGPFETEERAVQEFKDYEHWLYEEWK